MGRYTDTEIIALKREYDEANLESLENLANKLISSMKSDCQTLKKEGIIKEDIDICVKLQWRGLHEIETLRGGRVLFETFVEPITATRLDLLEKNNK